MWENLAYMTGSIIKRMKLTKKKFDIKAIDWHNWFR